MQFDPNKIDGCRLWLDGADLATMWQDTAGTIPVTANGQNVKRWTDKSIDAFAKTNNNNHATEAASFPTYGAAAFPGGLPAVAFNGSQQLVTPSMMAGYGSAISIYIIAAGGDGTNRLLVANAGNTFWMERNGASGNAKWQTAGLSSNSPSLTGLTTGARCDAFGYNGNKVRLSQMTPTQRRDLAGQIYNGRRIPTTGTLTMAGALTIGGITGGGFGWLGQIAEMVVYNRFLDESEDRDLLEYFGGKWGLGGSGKKFILCSGDSITDGFGLSAGQSFPELMQTSLGSTAIVERSSYAGRVIKDAMAEMYADVLFRSWTRQSSGRQVVNVLLGSNDLQSLSAATVEAQFTEYCQRLAQTGFFPIVCTVLPRVTGGAPFETARQSFNAWLRTNYGTFAYGLADLGADATIGLPGSYTNTTYYLGDQIHPTAAGAVIVQGLVQPVASRVAALTTSQVISRGRMIGGI